MRVAVDGEVILSRGIDGLAGPVNRMVFTFSIVLDSAFTGGATKEK